MGLRISNYALSLAYASDEPQASDVLGLILMGQAKPKQAKVETREELNGFSESADHIEAVRQNVAAFHFRSVLPFLRAYSNDPQANFLTVAPPETIEAYDLELGGIPGEKDLGPDINATKIRIYGFENSGEITERRLYAIVAGSKT